MKTNNYLGKPDENRGIIIFFMIFGVILAIMLAIMVISNFAEGKETQGASSIDQIKSQIEKQVCDINKFELADSKLVIEGELKQKMNQTLVGRLISVNLVLKNKNEDKYEYDADYYISTEGIEFSIIKEDETESQLDLNNIEKDEYFMFLRLKYESTDTEEGYRYRYYTLNNTTENNELKYNDFDILFKTSDMVSSYLTIKG